MRPWVDTEAERVALIFVAEVMNSSGSCEAVRLYGMQLIAVLSYMLRIHCIIGHISRVPRGFSTEHSTQSVPKTTFLLLL